jgi:hypothetical protein
MSDHEQGPAARGGERRGGDRRHGDRRGVERRAPPPAWRRPWALVAYGVLGALAAVALWNAATAERASPVQEEPIVHDTAGAVVTEGAEPVGPPRDAFGAEGFETLMVEGEAAVGRIVRAELFCGAASHFTVIQGTAARPSVAELIQDGRVPAAECKWGRPRAERREDFLLLIPPARAEDFASAPVVVDNYVERRRLVAEVEWIGRSETLALRTGGVFRGLAER